MAEKIVIATICLAFIGTALWLCFDILTTPDDPHHRYE